MKKRKILRSKKGMSMDPLSIIGGAIIILVLVIFGFVFIRDYLGTKGKGALDEFSVISSCKQFYLQHPSGNKTRDEGVPEICKPNLNQYCETFDDYCCNLFPDKQKMTSKNFVGCCIPGQGSEGMKSCPGYVAAANK